MVLCDFVHADFVIKISERSEMGKRGRKEGQRE
jgi:hypothetical protein